MKRRVFLQRLSAFVAAAAAGGANMAQLASDRIVRLTTVVGPRGEQFLRDARSGAMWLVRRDASPSSWAYGSDAAAQDSFRTFVRGAQVFVDGVWWDIANFPP